MCFRLIFILHGAWKLSFPAARNTGAWAGHLLTPEFQGWDRSELVPACLETSSGVEEVRVLEIISSTEFTARMPRQVTTSTYNALMEVLCPAN